MMMNFPDRLETNANAKRILLRNGFTLGRVELPQPRLTLWHPAIKQTATYRFCTFTGEWVKL